MFVTLRRPSRVLASAVLLVAIAALPASTADAIFPIVAAILVVALLGGWLLRNRARSSRP